MRYHVAMKKLLLGVLLISACGDDDGARKDADVSNDSTAEVDTLPPDDSADAPDLAPDTTPDIAPDSASDTTPDVPPDTAADAPDEPDVIEDTGFPEVTYAETLLPVDPSFDESYVSKGDLVVTTLVEVLRPRFGLRHYIDASGELLVPAEEFGHLEAQPGEPHLLRDQLAIPAAVAVALTPGALPAGSRSLLFGLVLADPQLVDQDSPAQVVKNAARELAGVQLPAYTPQGELAVHANDALFRSADRFQDDRLFDVVMIAGDHIENSQQNELHALHTLLNGGLVSSDSGALDDPTPGPDNDAFDPFIAGGFRAGTPWISSIGNHDVNIEGNFPVGLVEELTTNTEVRAKLDALAGPLGLAFPYYPTSDLQSALFPHAIRSAFRVDPDDFNPAMMTTPEELMALAPGITPADPARAPMGVCGFVHETYSAAGDPPGHGYSEVNDSDCTGFYLYDPVPGVPIRIISLDLGPHEGGSNGILAPPYADGQLIADKVGDPQFDQVAFLKAALADAEADGVGVIILSHQASDAIVLQSQLQDLAGLLSSIPDLAALIDKYSPVPVDPMTSPEFRALLASSPAVIAHIAGHNHRNRVRAICPDGSDRDAAGEPCDAGPNGETGYWEITTASGIDFPHQARFLEVVQVAGRLAALYLTMQEPRIPAGSFAERARFISTADGEIRGGFGGLGEIGDRNLLLPFSVSDTIAANWEGIGTTKIESETSLLGSHAALPKLPVWPSR